MALRAKCLHFLWHVGFLFSVLVPHKYPLAFAQSDQLEYISLPSLSKHTQTWWAEGISGTVSLCPVCVCVFDITPDKRRTAACVLLRIHV